MVITTLLFLVCVCVCGGDHHFHRGIQRTTNRLENVPIDRSTVQGVIEMALAKFKPINDYTMVLSSR